MERPNTWRTILPEFQEPKKDLTPTRRVEHLKSSVADIFRSQPVIKTSRTPTRPSGRNETSNDNILSCSSFTPSFKPILKVPMKNRVSNENPLNYKFATAKTQRPVNVKITESRVECLKSTRVAEDMTRKVNIKNSETFLDFLPGSLYAKTPPPEKPMMKVLNKKNLCSVEESKNSYKKLKTNKLHNKFSIYDQFN